MLAPRADSDPLTYFRSLATADSIEQITDLWTEFRRQERALRRLARVRDLNHELASLLEMVEKNPRLLVRPPGRTARGVLSTALTSAWR
jgi:hypothetical protein